jgi:hypothetical protein
LPARAAVHVFNGAHEMLQVAQRVFPLPFRGFAVAEHDIVAVIGKIGAPVAELVSDGFDILGQPGQEQPAGAGVEGIGILFEAFGRVAFGFD